VVGLQRLRLADHTHGHRGAGPDDPVQLAVAVRGQVDDDHVRQAEVCRHVLEQDLQGVNAARRSADADDGRSGLLSSL
jgi:hypothetical protein